MSIFLVGPATNTHSNAHVHDDVVAQHRPRRHHGWRRLAVYCGLSAQGGVYLDICLHICLDICLHICLDICLDIYLGICLGICLRQDTFRLAVSLEE